MLRVCVGGALRGIRERAELAGAVVTDRVHADESARIVLCSRSIFPDVVGEYGAVSGCLIPFVVAQLVEAHRPRAETDRVVNTLPLSVRICSGTPWRADA